MLRQYTNKNGQPCTFSELSMTEQFDVFLSNKNKTGIFADHNCWRCKDGEKPCVQGSPSRCEYPRARND